MRDMLETHEGDWGVFRMACSACTYAWVSVAPAEVKALECPRCHAMEPAPEEAGD